ncbi:glycoside hydrolase family 3 protein [Rhodohalobacter sp.]|uniref:glycoside hydrolase family 3 protein n=1 Tax=Rhodohalobacter sp. TaxID=1974210 RepID=UPI002ACD49D2|nr:glycoside hydrolase family 3 protein [Rhodohalobacter sp.]MDZ7755624.1 glycoside hydrolase family 3 protein [Rhodohalobacter sp.]
MNFSKFSLISLFFIFFCNSSCSQPVTEQNPSLEEKIGQMLMIGFRGFTVDDSDHIVRDLTEYHLGGVILFDYDVPTSTAERNIRSFEQVQNLNSQLQKISAKELLIAVDQEGGRVARLKPTRGFQPHVSAEYLGEIDNADSTRYYASSMSAQLEELGFNINFAPVVDLNTNPENPVIGAIERSFSENPELVTKHASIFLDEFEKHGITGVLKHFPGHGSAWNDSHVGMADVTDTWQESELKPYENLIKSGRDFAIMTAHVFNENLDTEHPATLSKAVQTDLLRDELEFKGVLFSDDMQMEAIRSFYGLETSIKQAINAGVDILVFGNNSVYDPDIVPKAVQIILNQIKSGEIEEDRIHESYERVQALKERLSDG